MPNLGNISNLVLKGRLSAHIAVIAAVATVVIASGTAAPQAVPTALLSKDQGYGGLADSTAAAYIAANVAEDLDMPLATEISNQARHLVSQVTPVTTADAFLNKPYVVATDAATNRDVITYTVVEGDTLASLASKFNVTSDTIRWANDLASNATLSAGRKLVILPVSGVLHTVTAGDTAESLATRYRANAQQIVSFNDAELAGLQAGQKIVIPDGVKQEQPARYVPSIVRYAAQYAGNGYVYGYCTWHAANRRIDIGKPIPSNFGNAISWAYMARATGYDVGTVPAAGAVVYHKNIGGLGHVAFVESVHPDGSATFSDMNYPYWGVVTERHVPASEMSQYLFIY